MNRDITPLLTALKSYPPSFSVESYEIQAFLQPRNAQLSSYDHLLLSFYALLTTFRSAFDLFERKRARLIDHPEWHTNLYNGFHPLLKGTTEEARVTEVLLYAAHNEARLVISARHFSVANATAALQRYNERLGALMTTKSSNPFLRGLLDEVRTIYMLYMLFLCSICTSFFAIFSTKRATFGCTATSSLAASSPSSRGPPSPFPTSPRASSPCACPFPVRPFPIQCPSNTSSKKI